jgi:hypothetical protein
MQCKSTGSGERGPTEPLPIEDNQQQADDCDEQHRARAHEILQQVRKIWTLHDCVRVISIYALRLFAEALHHGALCAVDPLL